MPQTTVAVRLLPLGQTLEIPPGAPLRDALFAAGVEFPCGGRGACGRCRVRVIEGRLAPSDADMAALTEGELQDGWRLACHARAEAPVTLEIAQWEAPILADDSRFEFTPREGLGVAIDLGTTTIVAQLVDLATGEVRAVRSALNPQAAYGADVMSRVEMALAPGGAVALGRLAREAVDRLVEGFGASETVMVGNTVMHHLFAGLDVAPLSHVPFAPDQLGAQVVEGRRFLPCIGGFVGSDTLAGALAAKMHRSAGLIGLIDLGTNAEVVFGNRDQIVCASTAAGPAFEAGRISQGMRAASGAISEVAVEQGSLRWRTVDDAPPRGVCGSGLVDAVACGLALGAIDPSGRAPQGLAIAPGVALTQADIRQLQLAKAAVAAGVRIVLNRLGACVADVERLYLAGAFGNYINRSSARRIGLIDFPEQAVHPAGNAALLGAKMALFTAPAELESLRALFEHVSLAADPAFEEIYVGEMPFPER